MDGAPAGAILDAMPTTPHDSDTLAGVHVLPGRRGDWSVRLHGETEAMSTHASASEAERAARRHARASGARLVVVHDRYCNLHVTRLGGQARA